MKLGGYVVSEDGGSSFVNLREVSLCTDAATRRKIGEFLMWAASEMEAHGDRFNHEHFNDFAGLGYSNPDVIVIRDPNYD